MPIHFTAIEINRAMFGLGIGELAIILVLILVVFGAGKIPKVGSSLGEGLKNFKDSLTGKSKEQISDKSKESEKAEITSVSSEENHTDSDNKSK